MSRTLPLTLLSLLCALLFFPGAQPALAQATDTPAPIFGVQTSTPYPDGAIVHEVQPGQTLTTIAEAYGITVQTLLSLNNLALTDPIFPGDRLIIRAAFTATPTSNITPSPTQRPPTPTRRPTRTPTAMPPTRTATSIVQATPTPTPIASPETAFSDPIGQGFLAAIIGLGSAGVILMLVGGVAKVFLRATQEEHLERTTN